MLSSNQGRSRSLPAGLLLAALALPARAADATITVGENKSQVIFSLGEDEVARYHIGPGVAKPYFFPVLAPGDLPVTRGWPMVKGLPKESTDHVHQKSAWFCHGDVIPDGVTVVPSSDKHVKGVDFWSEGKGHGKIVCTEVVGAKGRAGEAHVTTKNEWRTADGTKILDETRRFNVLELLRALGDRFEQVILITHIEQVRDGLDQVISVRYDSSLAASVVEQTVGGGAIGALRHGRVIQLLEQLEALNDRVGGQQRGLALGPHAVKRHAVLFELEPEI